MANSYAPLRFIQDNGDVVTVGDPRYANTATGQPGASNTPGKLVPASGDGTGATDTAAIQKALDAAGTAGGGIVWLDGAYYLNGPVYLRTGVSLRGTGWKTVVHLAKGANSSMIVAPNDAYWYEIRDMQLDGHKEDQTGGNAGIELLSNTTPDGEMASCGVPFIERVLVRYTYGHGIYSKAVEARHSQCFVFRAGGAGFYADRSDMWYTDCTVGESYSHGFHFTGSGTECRLSGCKAWWPGYGAARGQFAWKTNTATLLNPSACSYYFEQGADHQQIVNCESQDAAAHGFYIASSLNRIHGMVGRNEGSCVYITGRYNNVDIGVADPAPISGGLRANPDSLAHVTKEPNYVRVGWSGGTSGSHFIQKGLTGSAVGDVVHAGNTVIMGAERGQLDRATYAATLTPDPIITGGLSTTLTGNITIANPADDRTGNGMEFTVKLTQDETGGRTVTWGNRYVGVGAINTAPSKTTLWTFRCIDSKWVQVAYAAL